MLAAAMSSTPAQKFVCPRCRASFDEPGQFCAACGADMTRASPLEAAQRASGAPANTGGTGTTGELERRSREDQDDKQEREALERRSREDQDDKQEREALERLGERR